MRIDDLNIENEKLNYIRELYAQEDEILLEIKQKLIEINRPININPEEGKLLQLLMKMINANKIVEIGTLYGYSTIWMAKGFKNLECNGNNFQKIYTIEKDIESVSIAKEYFKKANVNDKIEIFNGNAMEILNNNLNDIYDMVFIDANKGQYNEYFEWADKHIRQNGLIVLDNTLLSGAVYQDELPKKISSNSKNKMVMLNQLISNGEKYLSLMIPTSEGLTIVIKK